MEITCDFCEVKFIYKNGRSHYNRSKKHYCSNLCLSKANIIHGLASKKLTGKQDKRYRIWSNASKRAKKKGFEFNITIDDIPEIPKYCIVLGIEIKENTTHAPLDSSPSLDRIDSTKGYIKGNIRIISNRANRIKSDSTVEELELILKDMKSYESS